MPLENLEEEGLPKNPDLRIAQLRFLLSLPEHRGDAAVRDELMAAVRDNSEPARAPSQRPRPGLAQRSGACGDFPQRGSGPRGAPRMGSSRPGLASRILRTFLLLEGGGCLWGPPALLPKGSAPLWALRL